MKQISTSIFSYHVRHYQRFDDEHLHDVIRDTRVEHELLGGGRFSVHLQRLILGSCSLDSGDYSLPVLAKGLFSNHQLCFGIMLRASKPAWVNGFSIHPQHVQIYAEATEFHYRTSYNSRWVVFLVDREELQTMAETLTGRALQVLPTHGTVNLQLTPQLAATLNHTVMSVFNLGKNATQHPQDFRLAAALKETCLNAFVRALAKETNVFKASFDAARRAAVMRRATQFLTSRLDSPFSSYALSQATGLSERKLEYLFREAYAMSPRSWSQTARLNRIRRELLQSNAKQIRIADIAMNWGFFHLGRFAIKYRQLFGERPIDTLRSR
jgi:AraC-like DNA-binding protein